MKASESVKNYRSTLRMYTNYTTREIKKVCKEIGPRESGSEAEIKAQEAMAEEMKTCCDDVKLEKFKMSKYAFMAWVLLDGIFLTIAVGLSFVAPVVSIGLAVLSLLCLVMEFLLYKEFVDPFFPKAETCNAVGIKKATGETKQRIIFSGHIDSAYEWSFTHWGGKPLFFGGIIAPFIGLIYVIVVNSILCAKCGLFLADAPVGALAVLRWVELGFVPFFIFLMFFTNFKNPVMGCNDNLTGSVTSIGVLKFLKDNNIDFEHTEVIAMTTGCEEAGLRGAKAYVKAHKAELDEIPTVFFGMDTIKELEHMAIYSRDMTGTVQNDMRVCALMKKGAELAGLDVPYHAVWFGASDAAQVSKMGVPAACLAAMDPTGPRYYHTRRDTDEIMEPRCIEKALDICLQSLFVFDEFGLRENYDDVVPVVKEEASAE